MGDLVFQCSCTSWLCSVFAAFAYLVGVAGAGTYEDSSVAWDAAELMPLGGHVGDPLGTKAIRAIQRTLEVKCVFSAVFICPGFRFLAVGGA